MANGNDPYSILADENMNLTKLIVACNSVIYGIWDCEVPLSCC